MSDILESLDPETLGRYDTCDEWIYVEDEDQEEE